MNGSKEISLEKIILGIDPGYGRVGLAVIKDSLGKQTLLYSECFETSSKLTHHTRLGLVHKRVCEIIAEFNPSKIGLETLLFGKNQKTALQVAEARGAIMVAATAANKNIYEYNPGQIKIAVTGYGKSDKKQVINMLHKIIRIDKKIEHDDEYDAIATAITCAVSLSTH